MLYDGVDLGLSFRADLIVEGRVILELKSVQALSPIHSKQLLNYLKFTGLPVGLLLNFNTISLRDQHCAPDELNGSM
ncbi:MAG: GxxExxY protein [Hymenobacter sp.]